MEGCNEDVQGYEPGGSAGDSEWSLRLLPRKAIVRYIRYFRLGGNMIRGVLLDFYGTLVHEDDVHIDRITTELLTHVPEGVSRKDISPSPGTHVHLKDMLHPMGKPTHPNDLWPEKHSVERWKSSE